MTAFELAMYALGCLTFGFIIGQVVGNIIKVIYGKFR